MALNLLTRRSTSIIEVVLAVGILGIAMPPLLSAFANASFQSIRPMNATTASFLSTDRMEEMVARRYRSSDGYDALTESAFPDELPVAGYPNFARLVTISFTEASLNTVSIDEGYKKVRVTVSWNNGANEVVVERLFANY